MAAKPPKPPGNFLKQLANSSNNNNHNINNHIKNNDDDNNCVGISEKSSITTATTSTCVNANDNCNSISTTPSKKANCNCTNITIMHLFHEMKQEFPTIPDTIVTQCVNENCHQRDNCIQMLRNELELNPIPVQSYPAKVLHPPPTNNHNNNSNNNSNHNHHQHHHHHHHHIGAAAPTTTSPAKPPLQQKPIVQQKPPLKPSPLKPVRPAPLHPPVIPLTSNVNSSIINNVQTNSPLLQRKITSAGGGLTHPNVRHASKVLSAGDVVIAADSEGGEINEKLNDMPAKTTSFVEQTPPQPPQANSPHVVEVNNNNGENCNSVGETTNERNLPRARPTTLNLNTQQQQQQQHRQRLNVQLQEHFLQQRNKQQTHPPPPPQPASRQQQQQTNANPTATKPLRKAPLPPIAPKPILFHHTNTVNNNNNDDSLSSHTTSPLSESEISVNISLSTPSPTSSTATSKTHHTQHLQNKSPIRHRSVITLQPEPPYTRDFFQATTATLTPTTSTTANSSVVSSPTNSGYSGNSQKSYTSVNLTLRPPTTVLNSALQPSAIDITAGPGFSGASGGGKSLSYSSTSYDARRGYEQNFHITVTDEGGVFSASRRRPQRNINQVNICENQYDGNSDGDTNNHVNSLYAEQQQHLNQQQQQQQQYLQQQQFHNNANVVAALQQQSQNNPNNINSPQGIGGGGFGNMCLALQQAEDEYVTDTLERQKKRRDKLAAALRENKKRLSQVEQEVNLITGPIPIGLPERLDIEIQKLRAECQAMLRSSNPMTQQQQQRPQQPQQQFPPQPFPRQRSSRPPPRPPPPRQTSLDIIQHHATPTTPHTPASLPSFINTPSPTMAAHQQQLQHSHSLSPSIYQQQPQQPPQPSLSNQPQNNHSSAAISAALPDDEPYYSDPDADPETVDYADDDEDDAYEVIEPWECSMCTFRNHPQLNICECCENVRILPEPVLSREDIHITLSPGENRIIHSWIVS